MKKKELFTVSLLTLVIAFMDITGLPAALFVNVSLWGVEPMYWTLMVNFVFIGLLAALVLKLFCPGWSLGFRWEGFLPGLRRYGPLGLAVALVGFAAFYLGLRPLDYHPAPVKVLVEGIIYYIGVALVEELYIRGLLLNLIKKLLAGRKHAAALAVILSSVIFGLGHIFGVLGQPLLIIVSKVTWTVGLGLFLGVLYQRSGNLWLPSAMHFLIDVCAIPACFSSVAGYAELTLVIILPVYLVLAGWSLVHMVREPFPEET